jgi:hypothetical protein
VLRRRKAIRVNTIASDAKSATRSSTIFIAPIESLHELDIREWHKMIAVDQTGVFLGMREAVRVMRRQKTGSIINVSSIWGSAAVAGAPSCRAAKGAVRNMSKNAAMTYVGDGIRVNSVHPGFIHTPLTDAQAPELNDQVIASTPMKRGGPAMEVAYGCLFLASDEASYVTGTELVIDGGYLAQYVSRPSGATLRRFTVKTSCETTIDHAVTCIDLAGWLQNLSDRDYQACSRSHRAAGVSREDGTFGSINVEAIGGHLLVQHYLAVRADRDHVVMHSTRTRVYLLHLLPVTIGVVWTLQVEPRGTDSTVFRCAVETRMKPVLTFVAAPTPWPRSPRNSRNGSKRTPPRQDESSWAGSRRLIRTPSRMA